MGWKGEKENKESGETKRLATMPVYTGCFPVEVEVISKSLDWTFPSRAIAKGGREISNPLFS